ncbi:MAG: hypothetical protein QM756_41520 [Polyangiaceae bacterium]
MASIDWSGLARALRRGVPALLVAALVAPPAAADDLELTLNGFGDVNLGTTFGDPASAADATTFGVYGEDRFVKSSHKGFGLVGTDFVLTAQILEDLVFLGEVNLQTARGAQSELEVDVERMFIEKRFSPVFNLQAGLFFTPVGYFNRTLYSRAYFMNSVQIPDLFEEELGLVPTHTIGAQLHGQVRAGEHRIGYALSVGNGRAVDPVSPIYARDNDGWPATTAMLEWFIPVAAETRLGISSWQDKIRSYQVTQLGEVIDILDPTAQRMKLTELGLDAHFVFKSTWVNAMLEGVFQRHQGSASQIPGGAGSLDLYGLIAELSLNVGPERAMHPYIRYDRLDVPPGGGPYLSLRRDGTSLTRVYVADVSLGMIGMAWDVMTGLRVKAEYSEAFTGPRDAHAVVGQVAFAF